MQSEAKEGLYGERTPKTAIQSLSSGSVPGQPHQTEVGAHLPTNSHQGEHAAPAEACLVTSGGAQGPRCGRTRRRPMCRGVAAGHGAVGGRTATDASAGSTISGSSRARSASGDSSLSAAVAPLLPGWARQGREPVACAGSEVDSSMSSDPFSDGRDKAIPSSLCRFGPDGGSARAHICASAPVAPTPGKQAVSRELRGGGERPRQSRGCGPGS